MKPLILCAIDSDWDSIPDRLYLAESLSNCDSLESLLGVSCQRAAKGGHCREKQNSPPSKRPRHF